MKLKYNIAMWCMAAGLFSLAGCSDDEDTWAPGPATQVAYHVYFTSENPTTNDLEVNEANSYTLIMTRENAAEALSLPLVVSGNTEHFDAPSTVEFAAGENNATITVAFKGSETAGNYLCSIGIADGSYNSPYTSLTTTIDIWQRVCDWQVYVHNLKITDYYGETLSGGYSVDLERDGNDNRYRLKDFMRDFDFVFGLVEDESTTGQYFFSPEGGSTGEEGGGDKAWFFDEDFGNTEFLLYHDLMLGECMGWGFVYLDGDYASYINLKKRNGYVSGSFFLYTDYNAGTGNWIYPWFALKWSESDETELAKEAWKSERE